MTEIQYLMKYAGNLYRSFSFVRMNKWRKFWCKNCFQWVQQQQVELLLLGQTHKQSDPEHGHSIHCLAKIVIISAKNDGWEGPMVRESQENSC